MNYTLDDINKIVSKLMWLTQEEKIQWKISIKKDEKRYIAKVVDQYVSLVEKEVDLNDESRILELNLKHQYNNIVKYNVNKMYKQNTMIVPLLEIVDDNQYTLWTFPYSPANEDLARIIQYSTANINKFIENILKM
jgi:hypothetical protein